LIGSSSIPKAFNSSSSLFFFLLAIVAIYTWRKPDLGSIEVMRFESKKRFVVSIIAGVIIGFYDGIFGPGTGSFLMLTLIYLGFTFLSASAIAKVVNISTNLGAIVVFGLHGAIVWQIALVLAAVNIVGGLMGARLAIRGGSTLIRKVFLLVTLALIVKVGIDTFSNW
jgi:uncharacterized membrane protein YfcA